MENFIKNLRISNFKSIRDAELECGRINLFVGKPNVGKSNVLEGLSLLGAGHSKSEKFMSEFIRYEEFSNLFHFQNKETPVIVQSDIGTCSIAYNAHDGIYELGFNQAGEQHQAFIHDDGTVDTDRQKTTLLGKGVKKYSYKPLENIASNGLDYLNPPHGDNLFHIMRTHAALRDEIPSLFAEYKLDFVIDLEKRIFETQRKEGIFAYKIPYNLTADTLRRMIFHFASILSNKGSVILYEEPESHAFPPYISELAWKIIWSEENQFFITTHSPNFFISLVENTPIDELAVFITFYQDYETRFYKLTDDDISEILNYGIDIFYNQKWFVDEQVSKNPA